MGVALGCLLTAAARAGHRLGQRQGCEPQEAARRLPCHGGHPQVAQRQDSAARAARPGQGGARGRQEGQALGRIVPSRHVLLGCAHASISVIDTMLMSFLLKHSTRLLASREQPPVDNGAALATRHMLAATPVLRQHDARRFSLVDALELLARGIDVLDDLAVLSRRVS